MQLPQNEVWQGSRRLEVPCLGPVFVPHIFPRKIQDVRRNFFVDLLKFRYFFLAGGSKNGRFCEKEFWPTTMYCMNNYNIISVNVWSAVLRPVTPHLCPDELHQVASFRTPIRIAWVWLCPAGFELQLQLQVSKEWLTSSKHVGVLILLRWAEKEKQTLCLASNGYAQTCNGTQFGLGETLLSKVWHASSCVKFFYSTLQY